MKKTINLTLATDIRGLGGIATVLNVYKDAHFFDKWNVKLIATHSDKKHLFGLKGLLIYLIAVIKTAYYLCFYRVGLVHIHISAEGSYLRKMLLVRLVKALNGRVILHLHSGRFDRFYAEQCNKKKQQNIRHTFQQADAVIVLSSQWQQWLKETIPNATNVHIIYNAVTEIDLKNKATQPGMIAFLGRIGQVKGVDDLINAFQLVQQKIPEAKLVLAGDGDISHYQSLARSLGLEDSVQLLGWQSGQDKDRLLAQADIYCLPSYSEGFPMGILEAMSANIAIVSSKAGGIPDAITDQEQGLLVDAGNVHELANALIKMISQRGFNQQCTANASKKFNREFSTKAIIPRLDSLYSTTLNKVQ